MRITYLGWQGWLISEEETHVLVDPLFFPKAGRSLSAGLNHLFWPPRTTTWDRLPPLSAVFISHEHEDHFDIPTLVSIDRDVRIIMSSLSSVASTTILNELNFVHCEAIEPGETLAIGKLEVTAFAPDHLNFSNVDEWDTLAYLFRRKGQNGGFFSNVDTHITPGMIAKLQQLTEPTLCFVGMAVLQATFLIEQDGAVADSSHRVAAGAKMADSCCEANQKLSAGDLLVPVAGDIYEILPEVVRLLSEKAPFVTVPPKQTWPSRPGYWISPKTPLQPIVASTCTASEFGEIQTTLHELAQYMYGGPLFRALYSLSKERLAGFDRSIAVVLMGLETNVVFKYDLRACRFIEVETADNSVAKIELFQSDFLRLCRGEIEPRAIVAGFRETWRIPMSMKFFVHILWPFFHPLRQPLRVLEQYRRTASAAASLTVVAQGAGMNGW